MENENQTEKIEPKPAEVTKVVEAVKEESAKKQITRWLIEALVLLIVVIGGLYGLSYYQNVVNKDISIATPVPLHTSSQSSSSGFSNLKTFSSDKLGFKFSYPENFGDVNVYLIDKDHGAEELYKAGSLAELSFSNKNIYFYISAYSPDIDYAYADRGFNTSRITNACTNPGMSGGVPQGPYNEKICRILTLGNHQVAWANIFETPECSPFFSMNVYLINPKSSYQIIHFRSTPQDSENIVTEKVDCTDNKSIDEAKVEAEKQSLNIFSEKNLSDKDLATINQLKEIVSSVEFLP